MTMQLTMQMTMQRVSDWFLADSRRIALVISALLSLFAFYSNDVLNPDGILYLDAAYQLSIGNWNEAYQLYSWLFFPGLIAGLSFITPLDVTIAAGLLSVLLYMLVVWSFLTLLKQSGADSKVMLVGTLLILIHPYINECRAMLLREPGLWAAFLISSICLLRFKDSRQSIYLQGWALSLVIGTLFRVEALAYLAATPLLLLFDSGLSKAGRVKAVLCCYLMPGLLLAGLLLINSLDGVAIPVGRLADPIEYWGRLYEALVTEIPAKSDLLAQDVLGKLLEDYSLGGIYALLGVIMLYILVRSATILNLALAGFQLLRRSNAGLPSHGGIFAWLLLITLAYLCVQLVSKFGLSARHAVPAALIIAVYASYGLLPAWQQYTGRTGKYIKGVICLLLVFVAVDGTYSFGTSKDHLRLGGKWLGENMQEGTQLLSNDLAIAHYAGRRNSLADRKTHKAFHQGLQAGEVDEQLVAEGGYIAVRLKELPDGALAKLKELPGIALVKTFIGEKDDRLLIYFLPPVESNQLTY